jgi:hypothetical protein
MTFGQILSEILDTHGVTAYRARPKRRGERKSRDLSGIYKVVSGKILHPQFPTILDWLGSIDATHAEEVTAVGARLMAAIEEEVCEVALYLLYALSPRDDRAGLLADAARRAGVTLDEIRARLPDARQQRIADPVMQVYVAAAHGAYERPPQRPWHADSVEAWRQEQEFAVQLHAMRDALARLLIRRVVWEGESRLFVVEWTEAAAALLRRAGVERTEGLSYHLDTAALQLRMAPPPPAAPTR